MINFCFQFWSNSIKIITYVQHLWQRRQLSSFRLKISIFLWRWLCFNRLIWRIISSRHNNPWKQYTFIFLSKCFALIFRFWWSWFLCEFGLEINFIFWWISRCGIQINVLIILTLSSPKFIIFCAPFWNLKLSSINFIKIFLLDELILWAVFDFVLLIIFVVIDESQIYSTQIYSLRNWFSA